MCTRCVFHVVFLIVFIKETLSNHCCCLGVTTITNTQVDLFCDEGDSILLPCDHKPSSGATWRIHGREEVNRTTIFDNGSLSLTALSREDNGVYTCTLNVNDAVLSKFNVRVRTPPPALVNVTVTPSTILALLQWEVADTGGYPITHFTAQYRLKHTQPNQLPELWHTVLPEKILPSVSQIDIYELQPNSSYVFQIWANNKLGRGEVVELEAMTMNDETEIELGKHLLEGAQTFDTRVWVAAVAIVMGTLVILASVTVYALYKECHLSSTLVSGDAQETMELIPNIILNPWYEEHQTEWPEPDENSNDRTTVRLNNNTVVNPIRM